MIMTLQMFAYVAGLFKNMCDPKHASWNRTMKWHGLCVYLFICVSVGCLLVGCITFLASTSPPSPWQSYERQVRLLRVLRLAKVARHSEAQSLKQRRRHVKILMMMMMMMMMM